MYVYVKLSEDILKNVKIKRMGSSFQLLTIVSIITYSIRDMGGVQLLLSIYFMRFLVSVPWRIWVHICLTYLLAIACAEPASLVRVGDGFAELHVTVPHIAWPHIMRFSGSIPVMLFVIIYGHKQMY